MLLQYVNTRSVCSNLPELPFDLQWTRFHFAGPPQAPPDFAGSQGRTNGNKSGVLAFTDIPTTPSRGPVLHRLRSASGRPGRPRRRRRTPPGPASGLRRGRHGRRVIQPLRPYSSSHRLQRWPLPSPVIPRLTARDVLSPTSRSTGHSTRAGLPGRTRSIDSGRRPARRPYPPPGTNPPCGPRPQPQAR
jgi:hypothetical protein